MRRSSTDLRHFIVVSVLVLVGTGVMFWALTTALPMPIQASTQAVTVDRVFNLVLFLIAFLFSLVVTFMIYSIVVFRRRKDETGEGEHFEGNTVLEIAWTALPLVLVVIFGFIGTVTLRDITSAQANEVVVDVEGFQWGWTFTYPEGFISPELVLPVDAPALMQMTSKDVNHNFWIVEMRVKQDVIPGQVTELRFTPMVEGDYKLRCAELCGLSHWSMLADVRIVSQDEYDLWLADQLAGTVESVADASGE
jgi:cytochrome c oxidase subunit 2